MLSVFRATAFGSAHALLAPPSPAFAFRFKARLARGGNVDGGAFAAPLFALDGSSTTAFGSFREVPFAGWGESLPAGIGADSRKMYDLQWARRGRGGDEEGGR